MATSTVSSPASLSEKLMTPLFKGDRSAARGIIAEAFETDMSAEEILMQIVWPAMERIQVLFRADHINTGTHHMASRLLRMLADQLTLRLERQARNGRSMLVVCSPGEPEELGAPDHHRPGRGAWLAGSLLQAGVPNDEIIGWLGQLEPQVLMVYGTIPRPPRWCATTVSICCTMWAFCPKPADHLLGWRVQPCGRPGGTEIGSDLFAPTPTDALALLDDMPAHRATPEQQTVGRKRRIKKVVREEIPAATEE